MSSLGSSLGESFGISVRQLRDARNWSQERLAEVADLNRSYVGEIERGTAIPSLATLEKIAAALGLSVSRLIEHTEEIHLSRTTRRINLTAIAC